MREKRLSEIKLLAEACALSGVTLHGYQDRYLLTFHVSTEGTLLIAKASYPRTFQNLTHAVRLLREWGISKAVLNMAQRQQCRLNPSPPNRGYQSVSGKPKGQGW